MSLGFNIPHQLIMGHDAHSGVVIGVLRNLLAEHSVEQGATVHGLLPATE